MQMTDAAIDGGRPFDWGRTSADYAKYRDIYPQAFYDAVVRLGLCLDGQDVLDLGTGTGVLPRNMYQYGARWTATDISAEQIANAKRLSEGMDIRYDAVPTEEVDFPDASFDVITACQCFWYFRHECVMPQLHRMLKPQGSLLLLYMAWLPFEDEIARASEELVLRYHPSWSGRGETMHPIEIPGCYFERFEMVHHEEFRLRVPFTRESWHGRMRACRGVGASLLKEDLAAWEREHRAMLERMAPPEFEVQHYAAIAQMKKK